MNTLDWLLVGLIAFAVIAAIWYMTKRKKRGCSGCCAECSRACTHREREP